eukprot:XP_001700183.1 predicted protein [Chlamydomonas reinhardtii]
MKQACLLGELPAPCRRAALLRSQPHFQAGSRAGRLRAFSRDTGQQPQRCSFACLRLRLWLRLRLRVSRGGSRGGEHRSAHCAIPSGNDRSCGGAWSVNIGGAIGSSCYASRSRRHATRGSGALRIGGGALSSGRRTSARTRTCTCRRNVLVTAHINGGRGVTRATRGRNGRNGRNGKGGAFCFTADLDYQLCVIACAIGLVRFGLNNVLRALAAFSANPVQWDKSKPVYYILKEVYQPLELLLFIAAICTVADAFVPQLIAVPRSTVSTVVRSTLSVSFIIGAATVVFNLKSRFCKENAWQSEMNGDVTAQRRWEAYDKLGTFVIYTITFVLGIQALGLEGIGGLAIGLAGREICENILNGFLIMSTSPFEVGDEVHFFHSNKIVEGMVLDIGWYRTTIRSYEREVFVIPNAVFSKNIVLNITRKNREWRFFEQICIRVQDVHKANAIIQDIRRIVRNDQRIITKLHRRIFLDKVTHDDCRIYVSFYVEAANRESFMAAKQDLLLAFVDCVERNGAKLAVPRTTVSVDPEGATEAFSPLRRLEWVGRPFDHRAPAPPRPAPPHCAHASTTRIHSPHIHTALTGKAPGIDVTRRPGFMRWLASVIFEG